MQDHIKKAPIGVKKSIGASKTVFLGQIVVAFKPFSDGWVLNSWFHLQFQFPAGIPFDKLSTSQVARLDTAGRSGLYPTICELINQIIF